MVDKKGIAVIAGHIGLLFWGLLYLISGLYLYIGECLDILGPRCFILHILLLPLGH